MDIEVGEIPGVPNGSLMEGSHQKLSCFLTEKQQFKPIVLIL